MWASPEAGLLSTDAHCKLPLTLGALWNEGMQGEARWEAAWSLGQVKEVSSVGGGGGGTSAGP